MSQKNESTAVRPVTIEGESWSAKLTAVEYQEWIKYDNSHPWLSQLPYASVLAMFLSHFRRGINLNIPIPKYGE